MVAEYVTGLKVAWDVAKALKVATDSIDDAHLKLQMAELISALADAKIEASENAEKIFELEVQLKTRSSMSFDGFKYYQKIDGQENEGPFCASCYDANSKQIRLHYNPEMISGDWECLICKGVFK